LLSFRLVRVTLLFNQHQDKDRTTSQCKGRAISVTHAH
jgi:hypothetical protein